MDEEIFNDESDEKASTNAMASSYVNNFLGPDHSGIDEIYPKENSGLTCLICGNAAGKHVHYGGQVLILPINFVMIEP